MPLINGSKYSCEPCIRGHRATSCAHTDRILIEVRKPGRPLESCGHNLNTCHCGRVAEIFAVNDVLSDTSPSQSETGSDSNIIVTTSSAPTSSSKSKARIKSQSRVTKRSKKKTDTPPKSPPSRSSPETSASHPERLQLTQKIQQPAPIMASNMIHDETFSYSPPIQSSTYNQPVEYIPFNFPPYQSISPLQSNYVNCPSSQQYTGPGGHQILYEQPQHEVSPSSRFEDVSMGQDHHFQAQQGTNHTGMRPHYILATRDSAW
ncbi:hypothetical protein ONS95_002412 [Cadophora gregata]|uniref:uncharacterized protein n=1 Tax=Cadophora gregata TaxID=51156 RepID=UPI0026DC41DF|nr:uncharacterized protein ONS95_002412 [Cadophora gregata]KAK0109733.1 hypothetical protein ONS95_002412 [Cadophora gregata]KAK0110634.1 hypothetical protein ONS96_002237 [Cadophora gregata f. sp. sojae]